MTVTCPNVDCPQYRLTITVADTILPDAIGLDIICGTCSTVIIAVQEEPA